MLAALSKRFDNDLRVRAWKGAPQGFLGDAFFLRLFSRARGVERTLAEMGADSAVRQSLWLFLADLEFFQKVSVLSR